MVCGPVVNTITAPTQGVFMTVGTFLFMSIPFQYLAQTQQRGAHSWPIWGPCLLHNNGHKVGLFGAPYCIIWGPYTLHNTGHTLGSFGAHTHYTTRGTHLADLGPGPAYDTTTQSGKGPKACLMGHNNSSLWARQKHKVHGR